jgi:FKBP-type peptidyl-prolyl cis-trans isomerase 2
MLKIVDTDETTVSLDTNHHMCGKVLEFEVTIKSIK